MYLPAQANLKDVHFFHLPNIEKIKQILLQKVEKLLDYCNSILLGCSNKALKILQLVHNAAPRVLTPKGKR